MQIQISPTPKPNSILFCKVDCYENVKKDVEIMIEQLRVMFDPMLIDSFKVKKLERLERRIAE